MLWSLVSLFSIVKQMRVWGALPTLNMYPPPPCVTFDDLNLF